MKENLWIGRGRRALYALAQEKLIALIHGGELAPGTQLPSQDELAAMLGVSRTTVREAVRGVAQMGLLDQRQGSGRSFRPQALASIADWRSSKVWTV